MKVLNFHKLTIDDREAVQAVTLKAGHRNCNFTFANLVGWQFWFQTEVCILNDAVILRYNFHGQRAYMICMPGAPSCEMIKLLSDDCGDNLTLLGLEDEWAQQLKRNACHKGIDITITPLRNQYDYIYLRSNLESLSGGKLKAKRNHVNKFISEYPDFEYKELTPDLFDQCRKVVDKWQHSKEHDNPDYAQTIEAEQQVMENIFHHWERLDMIGGALFVSNKMVAFTYGSKVTDDTIDVCVEKADTEIDGVYSVINQQFAAHLPESIIYINREEDMGLPGLRKAKLSYHPEILLSFNAVHIA